MLSTTALRKWSWWHKWTSLACTVFMLLLCLTGLPLIFHHEIEHLLGTEIEAPHVAHAVAGVDLDTVFATAQARAPGLVPQFASLDEESGHLWYFFFGDTPTAEETTSVVVDARTAEVIAEPNFREGFLYLMFRLHVDLFAGLAGKLFLGLMGLLFVIAIVSGVVLYAPFMRKLRFGEVRRHRSVRVKWLDLHNLLGVVTVVWALAVGFTGVINTWADLIIKYWQLEQLEQLTTEAANQAVVTPAQFASLQQAVTVAQEQASDLNLSFIAFPGTHFSSPQHFAVFLRGTTPLTSRLITPVLVDAASGEFTDRLEMPWYVTTLLLSQPLHFGDYGGLPLQIIWARLDVITIVVLWSGLVLWWRKRKQPLEFTTREQAYELPGQASPLATRNVSMTQQQGSAS